MSAERKIADLETARALLTLEHAFADLEIEGIEGRPDDREFLIAMALDGVPKEEWPARAMEYVKRKILGQTAPERTVG